MKLNIVHLSLLIAMECGNTWDLIHGTRLKPHVFLCVATPPNPYLVNPKARDEYIANGSHNHQKTKTNC